MAVLDGAPGYQVPPFRTMTFVAIVGISWGAMNLRRRLAEMCRRYLQGSAAHGNMCSSSRTAMEPGSVGILSERTHACKPRWQQVAAQRSDVQKSLLTLHKTLQNCLNRQSSQSFPTLSTTVLGGWLLFRSGTNLRKCWCSFDDWSVCVSGLNLSIHQKRPATITQQWSHSFQIGCVATAGPSALFSWRTHPLRVEKQLENVSAAQTMSLTSFYVRTKTVHTQSNDA